MDESHRSFVVETFFTNNGSITATQRLFRTHFKLGRRDPVPSRNTILLWIKNFRKNGSVLKGRSTGRPRTYTTPENAMAVKASVQHSPQRCFQQDGATAHTSQNAIKILKEMFPNHLISMRGDIGWPPRSPDLNPCDYFLWGYLKSKVYTQRPRAVEELKDAIRHEIAAITPEMINRVIDHFHKRVNLCVDNHGKHLTDLIFKT